MIPAAIKAIEAVDECVGKVVAAVKEVDAQMFICADHGNASDFSLPARKPASCYNGLKYGGGSYTLCRLILGNIAKRAKNVEDFKKNHLPYVCQVMADYMDARIRFIVEESGFFENNSSQRKASSTETVLPRCSVWSAWRSVSMI